MSDSPNAAVRQNFEEALARLRVESETLENGEMEVRVDCRPAASPESARRGDWTLRFRLKDGMKLRIARPPGLIRGQRYHYTQGDSEYTWDYGVPSAGKHRPPTARTSGRRARRERFGAVPVQAVLDRLAEEQGLLDASKEAVTREAGRLWRDVWAEIGPKLHPEALELAARYELEWRKYEVLARREDLRQVVRQAPGIGCRVREVPTRGRKLKRVVSELLGYSYDGGSRGRGGEFGDFPGFQAWVRAVPWSSDLLPVTHLPGEEKQKSSKQIDDAPWELMMRLGDVAREGALDPNQVRKLQSPAGWLLLHTGVERGARLWWTRLVLHDPQVTERHFERHFPRERYPGRSLPVRVARAVREVEDWKSALWSASYTSKRWAERLEDPSLELPNVGERVRGFARASRETARYRSLMERVRRMHRFSGSPSGNCHYVLLAPPADVARVLQSPEFTWSLEEFFFLLARAETRQHPEIRRLLLERVESEDGIQELLRDGRVEEVRPLWLRLGEKNPEAALAFLEQRTFQAGEGWQAEDLMPLFQKGGDRALRAMPLASRLAAWLEEESRRGSPGRPEMAEAPLLEPPPEPTQPQFNLFGDRAASTPVRARGR